MSCSDSSSSSSRYARGEGVGQVLFASRGGCGGHGSVQCILSSILLLLISRLRLGVLWVLLLGRIRSVRTVCTCCTVNTCTPTTPVLFCSELGVMRISGVGSLHAGVVVVGAVCGRGQSRRTGKVALDHGGRARVAREPGSWAVSRVGAKMRAGMRMMATVGDERIGGVIEEEGGAPEGGGVEGIAF